MNVRQFGFDVATLKFKKKRGKKRKSGKEITNIYISMCYLYVQIALDSCLTSVMRRAAETARLWAPRPAHKLTTAGCREEQSGRFRHFLMSRNPSRTALFSPSFGRRLRVILGLGWMQKGKMRLRPSQRYALLGQKKGGKATAPGPPKGIT